MAGTGTRARLICLEDSGAETMTMGHGGKDEPLRILINPFISTTQPSLKFQDYPHQRIKFMLASDKLFIQHQLRNPGSH